MTKRFDYVVERSVPVGGPSTIGAVVAFALASGVVVFAGVGLLAWALAWTVKVALGLAGCAVLLAWLWVGARIGSLWFATESVATAQPPDVTPRPAVEVTLHDVDRGRWAFGQLPGEPRQLATLARGVLAGRSLSYRNWSGGGNLFTEAAFAALMGELTTRGLARPRRDGSPRGGVELTRGGRLVFEQLTTLDACGSVCPSDGVLVSGERAGGQGGDDGA